VILGIPAKDKEQLYRWYSKAIEWLVDSGKGQLIFDDILDYYFIAEVESASTFEEIMEFGNLTVEFTAEPFKQNVYLAGSEEWDLFNFEDDAMQDVEFYVVGSKTITLYNTGRVVSPMINTDSVMYLVKDEVTYDLVVGDNKKYGFKLQNGTNSIEIYGTGHVKFLFRKEVL
jgi:phage-related protein